MITVDTNSGEDEVYNALVRRVGQSFEVRRERLDVGDAVVRSTRGDDAAGACAGICGLRSRGVSS